MSNGTVALYPKKIITPKKIQLPKKRSLNSPSCARPCRKNRLIAQHILVQRLFDDNPATAVYPFHSRPILRMLPLRHLRPGGEASLRTPVQLRQFPLVALHTVKPNFSQSCLLRVSSTTYTYLSHVIPPPVPRRRPVPLLALSPFSLCGVPGGSPADTGPYPRGE